MSNAKTTLGVQWKIGDGGSPEVFTAVAEVTSVKPPSMDSNLIDVTTHNNTTGFEEMITSALTRMEEITMKINLLVTDPTHDHLTGVMYLAKNKNKRNMQVVLPASSANRTFTFAGICKKFDIDEMGVDAALTATVTVKPTDYLTIT
jgi:hypothetical protein